MPSPSAIAGRSIRQVIMSRARPLRPAMTDIERIPFGDHVSRNQPDTAFVRKARLFRESRNDDILSNLDGASTMITGQLTVLHPPAPSPPGGKEQIQGEAPITCADRVCVRLTVESQLSTMTQ